MKQKKRKTPLKNTRIPKKSGIILGSLLTLGIVTVGTYAWFTSTDEVTNAFEGTQLVAELDEVFQPNLDWTPGETTTKEIRVRNTGETPAFVRISIYEFFLSLQVDVTDQTGNGNLKTVDTIIKPEVDENNTDTWETAAQNHGTYTKNGKNYIANTAIVSNPTKNTGMYEYNSAERQNSVLNYVTLNFSTAFQRTTATDAAKKWVYENGYFYYLLPLEPGEESEPLLDSVTLSDEFPNSYKGSLYKLKVYMDAHDQTKPLLDEWHVDKTGSLYSVLEQQLK